MKKVLTVSLSLALVAAISVTSWAQEPPEPVVSDAANAAVVEGAVAAEPIPMIQSAPMMMSNCGCNQTFTAAPFQMMATPVMSPMATTIPSTDCGCSGMIGQVGYNEIVQTATPTATPIVSSAPTVMSQPNGCCNPTFGQQVVYSPTPVATAPTTFSAPMTQCCPTTQPRWANNQCIDPCDPCAQQQRGLFRGRFFGRR